MKRFKVYLILIIFSFLLLSCRVSQQRCNELYPPQITEVTVIKTDTLVKDSIIKVTYVLRDTTRIELKTRLPPLKNKTGKLTVQINNTDSGSVIECFADSLESIIKQQTIQINTLKETLKKEQYKPPEKSFWGLLKEVFPIALLLLLFLFLIRRNS